MIKRDKRIKIIQEKIKETGKKFTDNKLSIEELENQLAECLALDLVEPEQKVKEAIETISERLRKLKNETELLPKIIKALSDKVVSLEEEEKALILKEKISKQQLTGSELCSVSKKFIESLKKTQGLNKKLRDLWASWNSQKEQTDYDELPGKTSLFSYDMLNYLNILISEYEGKEVRKREYFSRVRI